MADRGWSGIAGLCQLAAILGHAGRNRLVEVTNHDLDKPLLGSRTAQPRSCSFTLFHGLLHSADHHMEFRDARSSMPASSAWRLLESLQLVVSPNDRDKIH